MQFWQLVKINLLMTARNRSGLFWTMIIPAAMYVALSVLPIGTILGGTDYSSFLLPVIIAFTIMQGGIYTFAYWMTDLRNRGIIRQISTTPVTNLTFILSLVTARSLVMVVQAGVLTAIGSIFFGTTIRGSVGWGIVLVIVGGFIFLPIGLLISVFADNYDAAAPITAGIGLPLAFLGNVFYPIQLLPDYLRTISEYLPLSFLADALRQVFLRTDTFFSISTDLFWLLAWSVVIFSIAIWRFKIND